MPRIRADDYDQKKSGILDAAAALFADSGFVSCKMQDIAEACNVSKSMLYHYFVKKEDVLFQILEQHLDDLLTALDQVRDRSGLPTRTYFRRFVETYLESSTVSRSRHMVALNDRRFLPSDQQKPILNKERQVLKTCEDVLRGTNPDCPEEGIGTYALLLIGMLNWVELWYRRSGKIAPPAFYDMITDLFLDGFTRNQPEALRALVAHQPVRKTRKGA